MTQATDNSAAVPLQVPSHLDLAGNVFWQALNGPQRGLTVGSARARRLRPGGSSLLAFDDADDPDFTGVSHFSAPGEALYVEGWVGPVPAAWRILQEATLLRMKWVGDRPPAVGMLGLTALTRRDADEAVALAAATRPGPFGPRTLEMGNYLGVRDGGRLVAMAGERLFDGRHREISGVCTAPTHRGRGLARDLMLALVSAQCARGEVPFLHVLASNAAAIGLYHALGFERVCERPMRVVARA